MTTDPTADVLFVCVHNAGRSRMAEALFNRAAQGRYTAASAGTEPASRPHPEVVAAMAELGVTVPERPGRLLSPELADAATRLVSMGCNVEDACPATTTPMEDWALSDPKGQDMDTVRAIRDDIAQRVDALLEELDAHAETAAQQRPSDR